MQLRPRGYPLAPCRARLPVSSARHAQSRSARMRTRAWAWAVEVSSSLSCRARKSSKFRKEDIALSGRLVRVAAVTISTRKRAQGPPIECCGSRVRHRGRSWTRFGPWLQPAPRSPGRGSGKARQRRVAAGPPRVFELAKLSSPFRPHIAVYLSKGQPEYHSKRRGHPQGAAARRRPLGGLESIIRTAPWGFRPIGAFQSALGRELEHNAVVMRLRR